MACCQQRGLDDNDRRYTAPRLPWRGAHGEIVMHALHFSASQVRWFRLCRSGLVEPFATPETAAQELAGVQAQILPAAALSLWNRTHGLSYAAFDALLHQRRTLVKLWGQRGTLHLYASAEWPLIHGACAAQRSWGERQATRAGTAAAYEQTVEQVVALLRAQGTLGRRDLRAAELGLDAEMLSPWGGVLAALVRRGYACHAGQAGGEGRFAAREYWLPELEWQPPPGEVANVELARRYLRAYGPATLQDFAYWRGAPVANARRWVTALGDAVAEVFVEGRALLALRADLEELAAPPPPREAWPLRLLYRFDPLLLGIKDKAWIVDTADYARVWRPAGHIEAVLLDHGRIAGVWRYDRAGNNLTLTLQPFAPLPAHLRTAVEQQAAAVAQFFGTRLAELAIGVT